MALTLYLDTVDGVSEQNTEEDLSANVAPAADRHTHTQSSGLVLFKAGGGIKAAALSGFLDRLWY